MILQVKKLKRLLFMKLIKLGNKLKLIKPDSCYYMGGVNVLPPPLTLEEEKELLQKLEYDDNIKTILIERNLRSVSYTHLDVYKRQHYTYTFNNIKIK